MYPGQKIFSANKHSSIDLKPFVIRQMIIELDVSKTINCILEHKTAFGQENTI